MNNYDLLTQLAEIDKIENDMEFFDEELNCIRNYYFSRGWEHYKKFGNLNIQIPDEEMQEIKKRNYEEWLEVWKKGIKKGISEQIKNNRLKAFKHLVERKNGNVDTVLQDEDGYYCYMKKEVSTYVYIYYVAFDSFDQYKKSDFYPEYAEKVNGFFFVPLA